MPDLKGKNEMINNNKVASLWFNMRDTINFKIFFWNKIIMGNFWIVHACKKKSKDSPCRCQKVIKGGT